MWRLSLLLTNPELTAELALKEGSYACLTAGAIMRLISLVILFLATTAFAQSTDLAYFCVGEAAGGLWYNQRAPASAGPRRLAPLCARPALGVNVGKQQSHYCDTEQNKTDCAHGSSPSPSLS